MKKNSILTLLAILSAVILSLSTTHAAHPGKKALSKQEEDLKIVVMLGPPGSGKGTQSIRLSRELKFAHISSGDLLRENLRRNTDLGRRAKSFVDAGSLVPDNLVQEMIFDKIKKSQKNAGHKQGVILDGFPRNLPQAKELETHLTKAKIVAIYLKVPDEVILKRIEERGKGSNRSDDKLEIVKKRLKVYHEQTAPVIDFYKEKELLVTVDGEKKPDEVFKDILKAYQEKIKS